jgi:hypothetical protein
LSCNENENQTAAYLGYGTTEKLRDLAASWPLLRAYVKYHALMDNLRSHDALQLLHTSFQELRSVTDPDETWPLSVDQDQDTAGAMKARHLACLLIRLKSDIEAMASHSALENQEFQQKYFAEFSTVHTKPEAPVVSPDHRKRTIAIPTLGPLDSESAVEPYNRCLIALKYLHHGLRCKKFLRRLATEPKGGKKVEQHRIPQWMLPKPPPAQKIPTAQATLEADNLPPIKFSTNWNPRFDAPDLKDELAEADAATNMPSSKQDVNVDPRLFPSMSSFQDQLRRQYLCNVLHMQIRYLNLHYKTSDGDASANMMQDDWETIQGLMRDSANTDFVFDIAFEPVDDGENIFETDHYPGLDGYFRTADNNGSELTIDELAIQERAAALRQDGTTEGASLVYSATTESLQEDVVKRFLDYSMGLGSTEDDIGQRPDPLVRFADDTTAMQEYYDGLDISQHDNLRQWQNSTLKKITTTAHFSSTSYEKPKRGVLSKDVEKTVADSRFLGTQTAESRERRENKSQDEPTSPESLQERKQALEDNERYYTLRASYSGTQAQVGPPLDLCLELLACEEQPNGLWRSKLLADATSSDFYHYQISGAVGCILKLYGRIDVDKLLSKSKQPYAFDVEKVRRAAERLHDLLVHGVVLADDVGFGKTKQLLLIGYLHMLLGDKNLPTLLVAPSTLVHGWIKEIRAHWKCFQLVVSFEDHDWKKELALSSLTAAHMQNFGVIENALPKHLSWLFDKNDPKAKSGLVITSYETHKARTTERSVEQVAEGEHYDPPRMKANGKPDWLRRPRYDVQWKTKFAGVWGLLLADEAQKVKNYHTGLSASLYCQNIPKIVLATATPFHNHLRDFLGMTHLLGTQARAELNKYLRENPAKVQTLQEWEASKELAERLDQLHRTDPLRLRSVDSKLLMPTVNSKEGIHKKVMAEMNPVLETVMIRRSASSKLENTDGTALPLRNLFKKTIRRTVTVQRLAEDELEYQMYHQVSAA